LVDVDAIAGVVVNVVALDEIVVVLDIDAMIEVGTAVAVDLEIDEFIVVRPSLGHEDSLPHGISDLAIPDPDVVRGPAAAGGDLNDVGARLGPVQDQAVDDDVAALEIGQVDDRLDSGGGLDDD